MKKVLSVPAVALFALALVLVSCGSSRNTTTKRYPYPGSSYPYPDGRYPQGYPYPGNYPGERYPDYGRYPNQYPPGHAKKIYRNKSAKVYAPGQRKKYDRHDRNDRRYDGKYSDKKSKRYGDDDRRDNDKNWKR